ncbi:SH3 domain-containing protein [Bosea sp. TWI1241]|uniref:SH3 domain-containing protein n=1 Tax=Bosea sp. TWI1241 TaxID=3148904 RepID=UPI0032084032
MALSATRALRGAAILLALGLASAAGAAQDLAIGQVSKLPIPRYVSLKSDRVNLREGPSKEHRTSWVFQRAGLPVEITAEFETWRRVRDADGTEGWVLHSLLSGRRTVLVAPWVKTKGETFALRASADDGSAVRATLEPGVIANVRSCTGGTDGWCRVTVGKVEGHIRQDRLWGVYPNEKID